MIFGIRSGRDSRDFTHIREIFDTYMEQSASIRGLDARNLAPVVTGFPDIDNFWAEGFNARTW